MSDQDPNLPRVAIKLGGSTTSRKKQTRPANLRRHRAHALGDDEDSGSSSGEDDNNNQRVRAEVITDLDWSTPEDTNDRKRPGGRSEQKRKDKQHRDRQDDQSNAAAAADPQVKDSKPAKWGLTINMKGKGAESSSNTPKATTKQPPTTTTTTSNSTSKKTTDDEALDSLLGNTNLSKRKNSSNNPSRSPEPEDYRAVPIDDFGATLLKSFGWDGQPRGKVKEVVPRHANLAGLGAKDAKGAEELTAWNQKLAGKRKDSRPPRLEDYTREERKKRQRVEEKHGDSYRREKERDRERERGRDR